LLHIGIFDNIGQYFNYLFFLPPAARPFLIVLLMGIVLIVLSLKFEIPLIHWFLIHFERKEDYEVFPGKGAFFSVLGMFIVITLFSSQIAKASIMVLALGDSISYFVGIKFGKINHPLSKEKLIEGNITGGVVGAIGAAIFVPFPYALISSLSAMILEGVYLGPKLSKVADDNVTVPFITAIILYFLITYI